MLKVPSKQTLKRYGLSYDEWYLIATRQLDVCDVCGKLPKSNRLCIDHEHVKGWKQMPDEERKLYVRGLLCYMCNKFYLARGMTPAKARRIILYLERYLAIKPSPKKGKGKA